MQIVADPTEPMGSRPSTWVENSDFVNQCLAGDLVGVTGQGHGVYVEKSTTQLWGQDNQWETSSTYVVTRAVPNKGSHPEFDLTFSPPSGESLEEATVILEGGDDQLANYILELTEQHGQWKTLTALGWEIMAKSEVET